MKKAPIQNSTVRDVLLEAIMKSGGYKRDSEVAPIAVLWPDGPSQWMSVIPSIREQVHVLTLGDYDPDSRTGPAIWIRSELARLSREGIVPVVYLPGYSKDDLRNIEDAPKTIEPLAYLQYRGAIFRQPNGKDWTIPAFFQNAVVGLGLDVDKTEATRTALVTTVSRLIERPLDELQNYAGGIDASFLNTIMISDPRKSILEWINDAEVARGKFEAAEWGAFREMMVSIYGVDPDKDGPMTAARNLGTPNLNVHWDAVWARYVESPLRYPNIPNMLRGAKPADTIQKSLFSASDDKSRWPQNNDAAEDSLRDALVAMEKLSEQDARTRLLELEQRHAARRESVWAALGLADLSFALEHLAVIARETQTQFPAGTVGVMQKAYVDRGWKIDAAAIDAVADLKSSTDRMAVKNALHALYTPWLWSTAEEFQDAIAHETLPSSPVSRQYLAGTCVVFADGLRFDLAARLADQLTQAGFTTELKSSLGPLPGVTPSAKPAQSPVVDLLEAGEALATRVRATGSPLRQNSFVDLLKVAGWQVFAKDVTGKPDAQALAWTEFGSIDSYGHSQADDLTRQTREEVSRLTQRVRQLLDAGWPTVTVITDHGWLLTPKPMDKTELPHHLTAEKKGRCVRFTHDESLGIQALPWIWDTNVRIGYARGISCFEAGKCYEHGGLSLQECVIPELTVSRGGSSAGQTGVSFVDIAWVGLRCTVELSGADETMTVDIRTQAGDSGSSIAASPKRVEDHGARLLIGDDVYEGQTAEIVVLNSDGSAIAQQTVVVGGEQG